MTSIDTAKHYYAFISHSTADEKMAIGLRKQLINYNIPARVRKEFNAPKRMRPIFVYQTDLAGTKLGKALSDELTDSKYLIVLCSRAGAKSEYVNEEVEHFIKTGQSDKIIPVILEGTPETSFPPSLMELNKTISKEDEIRGINFPKMAKDLGNRRGAVVNLIASMLGVRFDTLWDIYKRKRRRKILIYIFSAMMIFASLFALWEYKRPTYSYYADYVDRWGIPEGVMPLTSSQRKHKATSVY